MYRAPVKVDITSDGLDLSKPLDPKKIPDENAINLACAILKQAADDYKKACMKERMLRRYSHDTENIKKRDMYNHARADIVSLEGFFRSWWGGTLLDVANLEGEDVIKELRIQALGKWAAENVV